MKQQVTELVKACRAFVNTCKSRTVPIGALCDEIHDFDTDKLKVLKTKLTAVERKLSVTKPKTK